MKRYDIRGNPLAGKVQTTKCHDCGMGLVDVAEFHPYEACETFKRTHDSDEVWKVLMPLMLARLEALEKP